MLSFLIFRLSSLDIGALILISFLVILLKILASLTFLTGVNNAGGGA